MINTNLPRPLGCSRPTLRRERSSSVFQEAKTCRAFVAAGVLTSITARRITPSSKIGRGRSGKRKKSRRNRVIGSTFPRLSHFNALAMACIMASGLGLCPITVLS